VLNAEYGGGEFAIFCKILADKSYSPSIQETSISIDKDKRQFITNFFEKYKVFSDNDIKRMFDSQYIMLICSTILEGQYFSRSIKINEYLRRYNDEFLIYDNIVSKIYDALNLIHKLGLSEKSYWFNKANLFSLIIEIVKFSIDKIDLNSLEFHLNELENKVDFYFVGEEDNLALITPDEMKYFEVARQGSHELNARIHRGKVLNELLNKSIFQNNENINSIISELERKVSSYSIIIPTSTGLSKNIMDATQRVRKFLKTEDIHNYEEQQFGPEFKKKLPASFIYDEKLEVQTEVSLYRSNGRGDYRIWFSKLTDFANESDDLVLINHNGLKVLNITKNNYLNYINSL